KVNQRSENLLNDKSCQTGVRERDTFETASFIFQSMEIIYQKTIQTPLGEMIACAVEQGICLLEFTDRKNFEKQFIS
ncbi:MAG: hypothetical protein L0G39_20870, partial [Chryseobacterium sp.]|nr:hypothetical protein [Chryseobacterium sp.]